MSDRKRISKYLFTMAGMAVWLGSYVRPTAEAAMGEAYVVTRTADIYAGPSEESEVLWEASFDDSLFVLETLEEGWCHVASGNGEGYAKSSSLQEKSALKKAEGHLKAVYDTTILDFPGLKDGDMVGELLEYDDVELLGVVNDVWGLIRVADEEEPMVGYVQTAALKGNAHLVTEERSQGHLSLEEKLEALSDGTSAANGTLINGSDTETLVFPGDGRTGDKAASANGAAAAPEGGGDSILADDMALAKEALSGGDDVGSDDPYGLEAGLISKGSGQGVFSDALDQVADVQEIAGVQVGTPVAVSGDATLIPLGVFRITHYCQCSICCGPYTGGITSTGVIATTNHTIAVDPTQIPYGSRVVINGQVYVAEDCGGAIKTNCIDIYVATHAEGLAKGLYYTDVYLLV